jgi:carbamoyl-phosphate synthase large subunit
MSSTPAVAKTIEDKKSLEVIFKAVSLLSEKPHGNFNFDLKGRENGEMCITECNVGRFCMITPIFDRTGKHSTVEYYIRSAFGELNENIKNPIDIEEGVLMLRELDTLPTIIRETDIDEKIVKNYAE